MNVTATFIRPRNRQTNPDFNEIDRLMEAQMGANRILAKTRYINEEPKIHFGKARWRFFLIVFTLSILLNACGRVQQESSPSRFEPSECRTRVPYHGKVECGDLIVPESRALAGNQPSKRIIRLHVMIFRSTSQNPKSDPVVFLDGGPGLKSLETMLWRIDFFRSLLQERDLIAFDQRGVGFSAPELNCSEMEKLFYETLDKSIDKEEMLELDAEATLACRKRLEGEGINLDAYNTTENAADVEDLRRTLGIQKWNLYGYSYGTRLALTTMRNHPQGIRSVVLDSPFPPQADLYPAQTLDAYRALSLIFERCQADLECNPAYPNLEARLMELLERLEAKPVMLTTRHPLTQQKYDVLVDDEKLTKALFFWLYDPQIIPQIPRILAETHSGNTLLLSNYLNVIMFEFDPASEGLYYSVMCAEEAEFTTLEVALEASAGLDRPLRDGLDFLTETELRRCNTWEVNGAPDFMDESVSAEIPTLVLSGEYDPITPPEWGRMTAENLNLSYFFEFPATSHGVFFAQRCGQDIVSAFFQDPAQKPNTSCIERIDLIQFDVP